MAHVRLKKDIYILFYINFKQTKKNVKKNFVNYDVK